MSCDHELANEKTRCSGKNASYIIIQISIYHTSRSICFWHKWTVIQLVWYILKQLFPAVKSDTLSEVERKSSGDRKTSCNNFHWPDDCIQQLSLSESAAIWKKLPGWSEIYNSSSDQILNCLTSLHPWTFVSNFYLTCTRNDTTLCASKYLQCCNLATLPKHTYVGGNLPTLIANDADKPSSLAVACMCSSSKYPNKM